MYIFEATRTDLTFHFRTFVSFSLYIIMCSWRFQESSVQRYILHVETKKRADLY